MQIVELRSKMTQHLCPILNHSIWGNTSTIHMMPHACPSPLVGATCSLILRQKFPSSICEDCIPRGRV
jgi:hypothetical protein